MRATVAAALVAVTAAGAGAWLLAGTVDVASRRHVVVDGVPLDEVHPSGVRAGERRPGVVVAHGFAGSARLMTPFADTLSAQGYVVVLLDFTGHGVDTRRLPDGRAGADGSSVLQRDLAVATAHLRELPDVDASRVAVVGHSMGAAAVTRYAVAHPEIAATAAISLPDASILPPDRPARLLLLVGGLEFGGFRAAVEGIAERENPDRSVVVVPGVEHISVLYAPRTHREIVAWLKGTFDERIDGGPQPVSIPAPIRRPGATVLLLSAFLVGLCPLARLLLGGGPPVRPPVHSPLRPAVVPRQLGRTVGVASVAAMVATAVAPIAPTARLPLAAGGFVVGFTAVMGAVMLGYQRWRGGVLAAPPPRVRPSRRRLAVAAPVLVGYAALTIAVPLHLGLTQAIPVGDRWWLLACVWAGFCVLAYAAERVAGGSSLGVLAVCAVAVTALTCAAALGLASSFLLLVVPLLAILMVWQAIWSGVLHRFSAPPWLIAPVGALLVAWPIAVALPVTG